MKILKLFREFVKVAFLGEFDRDDCYPEPPSLQHPYIISTRNIPVRCTLCKYYSATPTLPCAVHPMADDRSETCIDWEARD